MIVCGRGRGFCGSISAPASSFNSRNNSVASDLACLVGRFGEIFCLFSIAAAASFTTDKNSSDFSAHESLVITMSASSAVIVGSASSNNSEASSKQLGHFSIVTKIASASRTAFLEAFCFGRLAMRRMFSFGTAVAD